MICPDLTQHVQLSYNEPGSFRDGLDYQQDTYDANNKLLQRTTSEWELGPDRTPRVKRTKFTDELGETSTTEYIYGPDHNQIVEVREHDYGGQQILRRVRTEYETAIEYVQRHIYNLPEGWKLTSITTVAPRTGLTVEYTYDGQPLAGTPGVVQHKNESKPGSPEFFPLTDFRGNVTQIKTYADAAQLRDPVVETRRYDIAGNVVAISGSSCCEQMTFGYTAATLYAYPTTVTRGAADPSSPARVTAAATYDFSTGLMLSSTDPNGRTGPGPRTTARPFGR